MAVAEILQIQDALPAERADLGKLMLQSAGGPVHPEVLDYLQPTTLDTPLEEMRARYQKNGYLWVSHLESHSVRIH
jgi:hypothetical protein